MEKLSGPARCSSAPVIAESRIVDPVLFGMHGRWNRRRTGHDTPASLSPRPRGPSSDAPSALRTP